MKRNHESDVGSNPVGSMGVSSASLDLQDKRPRMISSDVAISQSCMIHQLTSNILADIGIFNNTNTEVLKCWLDWVAEFCTINIDGTVRGYLEKYMPGWLYLQIGRHLWPRPGDNYYVYSILGQRERHTSVAFVNLLRTKGNNGYLVDRGCYHNWLQVTDYGNIKPIWRKNATQNSKGIPIGCYMIKASWETQPGCKAPNHCWLTISRWVPTRPEDFIIEILDFEEENVIEI